MTTSLPRSFARRTVRKLKYPDHVAAVWSEIVLGGDDRGEWAVLPAREPIRRDSGTVLRYRSPQLFFYPQDGWWVARLGVGPAIAYEAHRRDGSVVVRGGLAPVRVDVSTPTTPSRRRTGAGIDFVDLVLDVVRYGDGTVVVEDEHEMASEASVRSIPQAWVDEAHRSCAEVVAMIRAGTPPFDGSAAAWLAKYRPAE